MMFPNSRTITDDARQRQSSIDSSRGTIVERTNFGFPLENDRYLSSNQQELLVAALESRGSLEQGASSSKAADGANYRATMNGFDDSELFMSPQQAHLDQFNPDFTPDLDYPGDDSFDFDNADLAGDMIGSIPGDSVDELRNGSDLHEKRKNSSDDASDDGDHKRQEVGEGEKGARKPGRKPLTSEPTTKRKAQNRAAQRAFRERKEQHLKDLETKVTELTKAKELDQHEIDALKAQTERLQTELRDTRKRLSLNGGPRLNRSPPATAYGGHSRSNSNPMAAGPDFQFEFPRFGGLPGSQLFDGQPVSSSLDAVPSQGNAAPLSQSPSKIGSTNRSSLPPSSSRENTMSRTSISSSSHQAFPQSSLTNNSSNIESYSTTGNMHGFASTLPQMYGSSNDLFEDLFTPNIQKGTDADGTNYFNGTTPTLRNTDINQSVAENAGVPDLNSMFHSNSTASASDTTSPGGSSGSQWNGNTGSSCGTSPEPSQYSPGHNSAKQKSSARQKSPLATTNPASTTNFDFLSGDNSTMPAWNTFDPVLFNDYSSINNDTFGNGDLFTNNFLEDTLNNSAFDYSTPSNLFGILQSPQLPQTDLSANDIAANERTPSSNVMASVDKMCNGVADDYGLPGNVATTNSASTEKLNGNKMISCNNIWTQLQSNPSYQAGKFDLDGLCSELRTKARCSETGLVVEQEHVDKALRKLGGSDKKSGMKYASPFAHEPAGGLVFPQDSWEGWMNRSNS